jgi:splicing factor 1
MTTEQLDAYTLHLRIEEITQKLKINDVVPADGDRYVSNPYYSSTSTNRYRSPSPPPQYDNFGRRVNTREFRYRKRLEDERHKLVEKAMKTLPNYHPPADYRRPTKTQEKVYVPVNDYPEINFSTKLTPLTFLSQSPTTPAFVLTGVLRLLDAYAHLAKPAVQLCHYSYPPVAQPISDHTLTTAFCTNSWTTHWTSWKHPQEDGIRVRRQDCDPWQGLCQRG